MIRKISLFFIALFGLLSSGIVSAQEISDITFDFRNDKVYVSYQVALPSYHYLKNVSLSVSIDDGMFLPISQHVSGDVGKIKTGGKKTIVWDCFADNDYQPIAGKIQFRVHYEPVFNEREYRLHKSIFYMEYVWSPSVPFGVGLGYGKRVGGYLRACWDTPFSVVSGSTSSDGYYEYDDDSKKYLTLIATGGIFFRAATWLRLHVGLGYGQIVDRQEYYMYKGLAYEAGLTISMFRKKWLGLSAGYRGLLPAPGRLGGIQAGISFNF